MSKTTGYLKRLLLAEIDEKPRLSSPSRTKSNVVNDESKKMLLKIHIKGHYISLISLMMGKTERIRDIFTDLKHYDPLLSPNQFVPKEPIVGDKGNEDNMRDLNLDMPLIYLKSNTIYLFKKIFYDQ